MFDIVTSDPGAILTLRLPDGSSLTNSTAVQFGVGFDVLASGVFAQSHIESLLSLVGTHTILTMPVGTAPGIYTVQIDATQVPVQVFATANYLSSGGVRAGVSTSGGLYNQGDIVVLTALLLDGAAAVSSALVTVTIADPSQPTSTPTSLALNDSGLGADYATGDGIYSGMITAGPPGDYSVLLRVSGTSSAGLPFQRTAMTRYRVLPQLAKLDAIQDIGFDDDANGLLDRVVATTGINAQVSGNYGLSFTLAASNGKTLRRSSQAFLPAGAQSLAITFTVQDLVGLGVDGPYTISDVILTALDDPSRTACDYRASGGATQPYLLSQLDQGRIHLTGNTTVSGIDIDGNGRFDLLTMTAGVYVTAPGWYDWGASLADSQRNTVGAFSGRANLASGVNNLYFEFNTHSFCNGGVFTLQDFTLSSPMDEFTLQQPLLKTPAYAPAVLEGGPCRPNTIDLSGSLHYSGGFSAGYFNPGVAGALTDGSGLLTATSIPVMLTLSSNPGGAALTGTTTAWTVKGVALFPDLGIDLPGTGYVLRASTPGLAPLDSQPFTVVVPGSTGASAATIQAIPGGYATSQTVATAVTLTVEVQDNNGVPVSGAVVNWTSPDGGSLANAYTFTDAVGQAQVTATMGSKAGSTSFFATIPNGKADSFHFSTTAGYVTRLNLVGFPTGFAAGVPSESFVVQMFDRYDNPSSTAYSAAYATSYEAQPGFVLNGVPQGVNLIVGIQRGTHQPGIASFSSILFKTTQALSGLSYTVLLGGDSLNQWNAEAPPVSSIPFGITLGHDPSGDLTAVAASMATPRFNHTATLLADGRVLVAGGSTHGGDSGLLSSAELFDPISNTFTNTGSLAHARASHTATLLHDGRVLFIGGTGAEDTQGYAEVFDPLTGTFSFIGYDGYPGRMGHTATLVGRPLPYDSALGWNVLIVGGTRRDGYLLSEPNTSLAISQTWNADRGFWRVTGPSAPRAHHTATVMPDQTVLFVGGDVGGNGLPIAECLFVVVSGNLTPPCVLATSPTASHWRNTTVMLPTGKLLVFDTSGYAIADEYDFVTRTFGFSQLGRQTNVGVPNLAALPDGRVLLAGAGRNLVYDPLSGVAANAYNPGFGMNTFGPPIAIALQDGRILFTGGANSAGVLQPAMLFVPALPAPLVSTPAVVTLTAGQGASVSQLVTVRNPSTQSVTVTGVRGPVNPFSLSGVPALPFTLPPGQATSVTITLAPNAISNSDEQLVFLTSRGALTVPLNGIGLTLPTLSFQTDSYPIANTGVGGTSFSAAYLVNQGDLPLTLTGSSLVGAPFSLIGLPGSPTVLAAHQTFPLRLAFSPTSTGAFSSAVSVVSNTNTASTAVSGTGVAATFTATPSSLAFGASVIGAASSLTVVFKNTGTSTATIASFTAPTGQFSVAAPPAAGATIGAGKTVSVTVQFLPTAAGAAASSMKLATSVGGLTVPITGTGTTPAHLSVSSASIAFGAVAIGATPTQAFTITNTGGVSLTFNTNSGPAAPFSTTGLPASNSSLAAGASVTVTAKFSPTVQTASTGTITINSAAGNAVVALSGTGVAPAALAVTPATIAFGTIATGTTLSNTFILSNTGGLPLTISSATSPVAPYKASGMPAAGSVLAAGGTTTITVSFAPTATGATSGSVAFVSTGGSKSVALTGTGAAPALLTATPTSLGFGTIATSATSTLAVTFKNTGGVPLTISSTTAPVAPFSSSSLPASGLVLAAGASTTTNVTFAPTATGTASKSLAVASTGGTVTVALTGTGAAPALLTTNPTSLSFGHVALNGTSSKTFVLSNAGGVLLTFGAITAPSSPFSASGLPTSGTTLAAAATKTVTITLHPTATGTFTGQAVVSSSGGNLTIPVTGQSP